MELVVGSTGQLGLALVRQLSKAGTPVRAFARRGSHVGPLADTGAEIAWGDLRDVDSLRAATDGIEVVYATANSIAPRPGDTYAGELRGYRDLTAVALRAGVQRLVFPSVPLTPREHKVAQFATKRHIEASIVASGIPHTILRCAPFMESWLALPGSSLPLRGEDNPTLDRPYRFMQQYRRRTGQTIERDGQLTVVGSSEIRHAFISLRDVAQIMISASRGATTRNGIFNVGGPEVLTWSQIAAIYARVLGREVTVKSLPATPFRAAQLLIRPFAPAASNIMGLNWLAADVQTPWAEADPALSVHIPTDLQRVEDFLSEKAALPATDHQPHRS